MKPFFNISHLLHSMSLVRPVCQRGMYALNTSDLLSGRQIRDVPDPLNIYGKDKVIDYIYEEVCIRSILFHL